MKRAAVITILSFFLFTSNVQLNCADGPRAGFAEKIEHSVDHFFKSE